MKVIHLLRKPCSEGTVAANVLRWGTGALNIDGTRVAHDTGVDMDAVQRQQATGGNSSVKGAFGAEALVGKEIAMYKPGGRWPANLVLQHLPECEQTGTREEAGYSVNRFTDGAKPFGGGAGHPYESVSVPPSTVAVWACAEGCPVAALDMQSGGSTSSMLSTRGAGGQHGAYSPIGTQGVFPSYGDTGGASRYFKQFGG
jgi:hypothetical protein